MRKMLSGNQKTKNTASSKFEVEKSRNLYWKPSFLGASPDGLLEDHLENPSGVIEIKCPYSPANLSVREPCAVIQAYYCYIDDDDCIKLNEKHAHYFQIQGTMGITNTQYCDLIVWTPKSMKCISINFDHYTT